MKLKRLFMLLSSLVLIALASLSHALAATSVSDDQQDTSRDAARCLIAATTENVDVRAAYCASLSPAIRRTRCTEHMMDSAANRRTWCLAEWQNTSPVGVGSSMQLSGETTQRDDCDPNGTCPCPGSPIVIDIEGDGFAFTDAANGVLFDLRAKRQPEQFAWTVLESDDGWLVLDKNRNGAIDDGSEMFGNYTCQPQSDNPQGFIALAAFDEPAAGGNLDSMIDSNDAVYAHLRIWQDRNHNGISEEEEFADLPTLGIEALSLDYSVSRLRDEHGNALRYRAEVHSAPGVRVGPFAYDVFLVAAPAPSALSSAAVSSYSCQARCRQRVKPGPGHDPSRCMPSDLDSIGSGPSEHSACGEAEYNCQRPINTDHCELVPGSLQCYRCVRQSGPSEPSEPIECSVP